MWRTPLITLLIVCFAFECLGPIPSVQADFILPPVGVRVHLSPQFNPPILKGLKAHADNPLRFDFILDKGDNTLSAQDVKGESTKLIKYFLTALTVPEKDLWVNLSPYEKDRIIPETFGLTEMGRDILAQDYMLKQITSSLIYPDDPVGAKFWKRIYAEAAQRFHTTDIPINTFNKVWIVPDRSIVYENAKMGTAYVIDSKLKVMLEEDYLATERNRKEAFSLAHALGSQIIREVILPELSKEINSGKNFASLRQIYQSLILGLWYKKKIKDSILSNIYINQSKVGGETHQNPNAQEEIYNQYLQALKKGAYNYIKDEYDPIAQKSIPKKYFSGGILFGVQTDQSMRIVQKFDASAVSNRIDIVSIDLAMAVQDLMPPHNSDVQIKAQHVLKGLNQRLQLGLSDEEIQKRVQSFHTLTKSKKIAYFILGYGPTDLDQKRPLWLLSTVFASGSLFGALRNVYPINYENFITYSILLIASAVGYGVLKVNHIQMLQQAKLRLRDGVSFVNKDKIVTIGTYKDPLAELNAIAHELMEQTEGPDYLPSAVGIFSTIETQLQTDPKDDDSAVREVLQRQPFIPVLRDWVVSEFFSTTKRTMEDVTQETSSRERLLKLSSRNSSFSGKLEPRVLSQYGENYVMGYRVAAIAYAWYKLALERGLTKAQALDVSWQYLRLLNKGISLIGAEIFIKGRLDQAMIGLFKKMFGKGGKFQMKLSMESLEALIDAGFSVTELEKIWRNLRFSKIDISVLTQSQLIDVFRNWEKFVPDVDPIAHKNETASQNNNFDYFERVRLAVVDAKKVLSNLDFISEERQRQIRHVKFYIYDNINSYAYIGIGDQPPLILNSAVLKKISDVQLKFLIGHEIGHLALEDAAKKSSHLKYTDSKIRLSFKLDAQIEDYADMFGILVASASSADAHEEAARMCDVFREIKLKGERMAKGKEYFGMSIHRSLANRKEFIRQIPKDNVSVLNDIKQFIEENKIEDMAMNGKPSEKRGGIDFTSDKALQVQNGGEAIKFHIDPVLFEQLRNASGFVPVIVNVQPLKDLRVFLGALEDPPHAPSHS